MLLIEMPDFSFNLFPDGVTGPSIVGSNAVIGGHDGKEPSPRI
jgi:hypothetical protein